MKLLVKKKDNAQTGTKEICVLCGAETEYEQSLPIDQRRGYVCGVGQLCDACYRALSIEYKE